MVAGLLLRFANAMFERNGVDFLCECVPMMVFMVCFFGFMDLMIMYKWVTPMEDPPSIINSLICMGMGPLGQGEKNPMFGAALPSWLMMFSVLSVPCMLIPKPLILWKQHQAYLARSGISPGHHGPPSIDSENAHLIPKENEDEGAHFEFGEIMIHQIIETIEYVLGTISHTASYLRLWALSLAHQQLSLVFFQKILLSGMAMAFPGNVIAVYILFAVWFGITLLVLMGMDVMECFLHVLRLHWIEFQGKFFKADGYPFQPYRIRSVLEEDDD